VRRKTIEPWADATLWPSRACGASAESRLYRLPLPKEALINAAMGSFAAKANVFLVKAASHSGGRERMA